MAADHGARLINSTNTETWGYIRGSGGSGSGRWRLGEKDVPPWYSRHWLDCAGHERRLNLGDSVVDRDAGTLVEDFDTEDLGCTHRAVFVGTGEGDVEWQDLIRVPGVASSLPEEGEVTVN